MYLCVSECKNEFCFKVSLVITWNLTKSEFPNDMDACLRNRFQNPPNSDLFQKIRTKDEHFWHILHFPQHIFYATEHFKFSESYRALGLRKIERSLMLKQKPL